MKRLNELFSKSDFRKNVLTLVSGTATAQIIPILVAPILSRIYSPEDFGRLAIYVSIVQILGTIACGRYELAIVLPKKKRSGIHLTLLSLTISFLFSVIVFVLIALFSSQIAELLGDEKLSEWLWFIPFSTFMMSVFNALNYFNTRMKEYRVIAKANIIKASALSSIQVGFGSFGYPGGLLIGQIATHFFGNLGMMRKFLEEKQLIKSTSRKEILNQASRYINFPKISLWGIFLNVFSSNSNSFFISSIYGLNQVGFYSYAYKYMTLPLNLIGNSISQVYYQEVSNSFNKKEEISSVFFKTSKQLLIIGIVMFVPVFFLIEDLFAIIFGSEWRTAGTFAQILIPLILIRFIVSPLSVTLLVIEKQLEELLIHSSILVLSVFIWSIGYYFSIEITAILVAYSLVLSFFYFGVFLWVRFRIKNLKYDQTTD